MTIRITMQIPEGVIGLGKYCPPIVEKNLNSINILSFI